MSALPRILVLTSTLPRWQGDTTPPFVLDLCRELAREFEVHVLAPHATGAARHELVAGVHVHRFRYLPGRWQRLAYDGGITARIRRRPWFLLQVPCLVMAQLAATLRLVRTLHPVVIHAHWLLPQGLVARLVSRLCGTHPAVLCTLHGTDMHDWHWPPLPWLKSWLLRAMTRVTAVSASLGRAAVAAGADPGNVDVVPMGVDVDGVFHRGIDDSRVPGSAVFVGRLVPGKGVEILLRAWAQLAPDPAARQLIIIGDGPARAQLEQLADSLGLQGRVHYTGALPPPAVAEQFRSAAMAVFPFTGPEGLGIVVAEAQACGCPVVVSDIPAMADLVQAGRTGIVVKNGDVNALAGALSSLILDPGRGKVLAQAARVEVAGKFGWTEVGARYRAIIRQLVSPPAGHSR